MRSQSITDDPALRDTTDARSVVLPFWMVREIALDLEEHEHYAKELQLLEWQIETYRSLVKSMQEKEARRLLQLELMKKNTGMLLKQLTTEASARKSANSLKWWGRLLAALGAGFLLGRI